MVSKDERKLSVTRQCKLLDISRSGLYYERRPASCSRLEIMKAIDRIHTVYPCYGFRRMRNELRKYGIFTGKKQVRSLMKLMSIDAIYPKPKTSVANPCHKIYPYLLRGLRMERSNQVWQMDITYIPMSQGFMYLAAIIDVHSRYVVGWDISNTMDAGWCRQIAASAIARHGRPEIFNTDQGSQFTSALFTGYLLDNEIKVSMDGRGRALDNVFIERLWRSLKQEDIYLHVYENGQELYTGLEKYFDYYNQRRCHQGLNYKCPAEIYKVFCENVA